MAPTDTDINPIAVIVAVAGALLGPKLALYVAAYGVIAMGWFVGVLVGLFKRPPEARLPTWGYVSATFVTAMVVTVTASELLAEYIPVARDVLLFPVAFAISAYPERLADVANWLAGKWQILRGAK